MFQPIVCICTKKYGPDIETCSYAFVATSTAMGTIECWRIFEFEFPPPVPLQKTGFITLFSGSSQPILIGVNGCLFAVPSPDPSVFWIISSKSILSLSDSPRKGVTQNTPGSFVWGPRLTTQIRWTFWLAQELNIELRFLPRVTPELNAMDHLWRRVKREVLSARSTCTIDQSSDEACQYLLALSPQERLRKAGVFSGDFWLTKWGRFSIVFFPESTAFLFNFPESRNFS